MISSAADARRSGAGGPILAIDVGGTKLAVGLVDRSGGLDWSAHTPTPQGPAEEVWATLEGLIGSIPPGRQPVACGVGCGGPMGPGAELVSPLNIPGWRDYPLRAQVERQCGLPTWVDNDAKALALADGWVGAAAGVRNYLSMVVSTGVGGGLVIDGRLLDGREGNAGHIGHVIVEPDGRRCACGARGCLEAEASGPSIAAITGRPPHDASPDVIARTGTLVGRAVATVANLLDLHLACVAGSVALGFGAPFFLAAQAELDARARLSFSAGCRIVPSTLGSSGPLIGAAAVARHHLVGS
jgi:glucokinase